VVGVKVGGNGEEEAWKVVVGCVEEEEEEWEDEDESFGGSGNAAIKNPKKTVVSEGKKGRK